MIHTYILLYALIAPLIYTLKIQQQMINHEIQELNPTSSENAPNYDVISVRHSFHKNSINELSIKIKINGTDKEFILQCVKGFFAGKDTKVWLAEKNVNKFKYTLKQSIMEKVNITFYHDKKTRSTISHIVNKRGISEFSGIIDFDKVIRPLKNYIRERRNVLSESFNESNYNNGKNYHIVYKRAITPIDRGGFTNYLDLLKFHQKRRKSNIEKPDIVYPEILVYVDSTLFKYFDGDIVQTVAYTLTLWNGVDLNFRDMENPEIRLYIAGIVLCQDQIVPKHPFVVENEDLTIFSQFMYNEDKFKLQQDYDIAVLLAADPKFIIGSVGKAYTPGACSINTKQKQIESVALILDDTNFSGIDTASHELAHLFAVPHDGEKDNINLSKIGAEACSYDDGFIMSYKKYDTKKFYFSQCSKEIMSFFFSLERAKCVFNNPAVTRTDKQILRILPGKYMTIDEQCQKRGLLKAYNVNPDICSNITCILNETFYSKIYVAALEGTPCDLGKFCIRGECVKVEFDESEKNSYAKILFPPPYQLPGLYKSSAEQCKESGAIYLLESFFNQCKLHCVSTDIKKEFIFTQIGRAQTGTLCNNRGYCQDGKCVDDPYGLVIKKTISTTSKSINGVTTDKEIREFESTTPFNIETTDNIIEDYESTVASNTATAPYYIITDDISMSDGTSSISSTNTTNSPNNAIKNYESTTESHSTVAPNYVVTANISISNGSTSPDNPVKKYESTTALNNVTAPYYMITDGITISNSTATGGTTSISSTGTTTSPAIKNYESTTESNSDAAPHYMVTAKISVSNNSTAGPDNTLPDMPDKFKSVDEQCKEAGTIGFLAYTDNECVFACKNDNALDFDESYDIFDEDEIINFLANIDYEKVLAQDGFPCEDNGYCQSGNCVNVSIAAIPNKITNSYEFTSFPDNLTTEGPELSKINRFELADIECKKD